MLDIHEKYMHRCLELAQLGAGFVAPNPMVGAVLVHDERIIGEGFHRHYGQAHAEVNCINAVKKEDEQFINQSTLYVSLEPCAHHGKTPPCADLIIKNKIPKVVVGCRDPFSKVDGKGIEKLLTAGVEVVQNVLEKECIDLNKRFFTFHTKNRPYIILKWAQSNNHKIANADYSRVFISNECTNRLVHKWRSEEAAILVGTKTALTDNPSLNVRLWNGPNPIRITIDKDLSLPASLHLFNGEIKTIVFNTVKHEERNNLIYYKMNDEKYLTKQIAEALFKLNIQSVLVEGGTKLLQSFINENLWDEARVINNEELITNNGLNAPELRNAKLFSEEKIFSDHIYFYKKD
jgi:diaminohydroxyphosphoribosylaminopyrimidine deaminase / 5-amino-6-(5-phosphoribosylamino)uracil reductase